MHAHSISSELEKRLNGWAYYIAAFLNNEVGYPSQSIIADFGLPATHIRRSKPPFPLNNLIADETNSWVNALGILYPHLKLTVYAYYLRDRQLRIKDVAPLLEVSESAFKKRLHEARLWLEGRLSVEINQNEACKVQHSYD